MWKSVNDARFRYAYKSVPYAAKPSSGDSPFYINATIDYIKYQVTQTKNQINLKGRSISTDRLYTSIEPANWSLGQNIISVGTLQKDRVGIPQQVFDTNDCEVLSKTCHFKKEKKDLCLTSYTVSSESKWKKDAVILAGTRSMHSASKDDRKSKPQIFKFYNFVKGDTEIIDQFGDYYSP